MLYTHSLDGVSPNMLKGFFVDWPNPPNSDTHLKLLENSSKVILAVDEEKNQVIGFITAMSDGVLSAYIPFLEVLQPYKNQGIGKELVKRMLKDLENLYMVDLCCDDDLVAYYEKFDMFKANAMLKRNYHRQAGACSN
ncbi:GNAT family N-acetyltransferase [Alkalihalobacillus pseudalcaliphilus]|uniref:GNAT family N-acetyltransferase n=1 Tax=Alkalihalobacillus pseudalcaliphilus TaxID=79884 RepID=UPI00064DC74B|nr:GNAT family N-acetyltransferase [Alkalihalobacillus pseudalcaliphilus]KMK75794.1 acetyltransferase [Alkalihalobacillus pseudalcaliphilus]